MMKRFFVVATAAAAIATLPSVAGHDHHHAHARHAREVMKRATTTASGAPAATSSPAAVGSSTASGAATAASPAPTSNLNADVPSSLLTLSGSDVPALSQITSGMPSDATLPLTSTYQAGATPPISGAPALPTFVFNAANYPTMDKLPDTTSEQVQEWMKELDGFNIPDLDPTVDGTCAGDPAAAADAANRGWWTCGGYTRSTDIVSCPNKGTWGMSFDDGPSPSTPKLLQYLSEKQLKATFFVVGSRTIEYPDTLRDEYMTGNEISVHTWSHPALTKLTNEQIVAELGWTRQAIQDILGVTPTTMRPPYGDIDDRVRAIALAMGLQPIIWTRGPENNQFDTNDWQVPGGVVTGPESYQDFLYILGNSTLINTGFIVLEHDLYPQTVDLAVGYTLNAALSFTPQLTLEPIGTCQGWPEANMYLETTTNATFPYPDSPAASQATTTASERAAQASQTGGAASGGNGTSKSGAMGMKMSLGMGGVMGALALASGLLVVMV